MPQGQDNHLGQDAVCLIPDGSDTGLAFSMPATVAPAAPGVQWGITMDTPLWSMLSCHFPAETPGFHLKKGDSWKNAGGAEEQRGTEQPARLGSQQHRSPPRDVEAGSCCLSYYLSQLLLSLGDPFKTPVHGMSPSAPSTVAADSVPLLLAHFPANTPYFSCAHLSPVGISY